MRSRKVEVAAGKSCNSEVSEGELGEDISELPRGDPLFSVGPLSVHVEHKKRDVEQSQEQEQVRESFHGVKVEDRPETHSFGLGSHPLSLFDHSGGNGHVLEVRIPPAPLLSGLWVARVQPSRPVFDSDVGNGQQGLVVVFCKDLGLWGDEQVCRIRWLAFGTPSATIARSSTSRGLEFGE